MLSIFCLENNFNHNLESVSRTLHHCLNGRLSHYSISKNFTLFSHQPKVESQPAMKWSEKADFRSRHQRRSNNGDAHIEFEHHFSMLSAYVKGSLDSHGVYEVITSYKCKCRSSIALQHPNTPTTPHCYETCSSSAALDISVHTSPKFDLAEDIFRRFTCDRKF